MYRVLVSIRLDELRVCSVGLVGIGYFLQLIYNNVYVVNLICTKSTFTLVILWEVASWASYFLYNYQISQTSKQLPWLFFFFFINPSFMFCFCENVTVFASVTGSAEKRKHRSHKFLCLRVGKPMKKTFVSNASASMQQYAQLGKKNEYWFAVPQERSVALPHHPQLHSRLHWTTNEGLVLNLITSLKIMELLLILWLEYIYKGMDWKWAHNIWCISCKPQALKRLISSPFNIWDYFNMSVLSRSTPPPGSVSARQQDDLWFIHSAGWTYAAVVHTHTEQSQCIYP